MVEIAAELIADDWYHQESLRRKVNRKQVTVRSGGPVATFARGRLNSTVDPRDLKGKIVKIDGALYFVKGVETHAVVNPCRSPVRSAGAQDGQRSGLGPLRH